MSAARFHYFPATFPLTARTVYWAQMKSFPLDGVVSQLYGLTHLHTRALCVMCCLLFTLHFFPSSLSTLTALTFAHIPTPIFTVWTCTDCGQQSIWDNGDCQCNVSHLESEGGRKGTKRKGTFSLVVGVEK